MKKIIYSLIAASILAFSLSGCEASKDDKANKDTEKVSVSENNNEQDVTGDSENDTEKADNSENESDAKEPDVQTVADTLLEEGDFKDKLAPVDKTMALTRLYALDEGIAESCAFYTNSNATAEEIAVIKVKSEENADTVKAAYEKRVEEQKAACKDYLPDEMPKLDKAIIYTHGNYVVLCVSNDSDVIDGVLKKIFE